MLAYLTPIYCYINDAFHLQIFPELLCSVLTCTILPRVGHLTARVPATARDQVTLLRTAFTILPFPSLRLNRILSDSPIQENDRRTPRAEETPTPLQTTESRTQRGAINNRVQAQTQAQDQNQQSHQALCKILLYSILIQNTRSIQIHRKAPTRPVPARISRLRLRLRLGIICPQSRTFRLPGTGLYTRRNYRE